MVAIQTNFYVVVFVIYILLFSLYAIWSCFVSFRVLWELFVFNIFLHFHKLLTGIFLSLEDASKKINKDSKKIVAAVNAQNRSCAKIGTDLVNDLGDDASDNLKEFELAMNKQAMLAADKVFWLIDVINFKQIYAVVQYCNIDTRNLLSRPGILNLFSFITHFHYLYLINLYSTLPHILLKLAE